MESINGTMEVEMDDGGTSPLTSLSEEIMLYKRLGFVLLVGDFNARTQRKQCDSYDLEDPI